MFCLYNLWTDFGPFVGFMDQNKVLLPYPVEDLPIVSELAWKPTPGGETAPSFRSDPTPPEASVCNDRLNIPRAAPAAVVSDPSRL